MPVGAVASISVWPATTFAVLIPSCIIADIFLVAELEF